jgi:alpha-galactosidase
MIDDRPLSRSFPRIMARLLSPLLILSALSAAATADPTVKVFVLAGQSNMQGHGRVAAEEERNQGKGSLEWLAKRPDSGPRFRSLIDDEGNWLARDDVQIHYLDRSGNLAPGFGAREGLIGPELGFGHVVGDAFDEPVLLIKIAWGGKSLGVDFRPPSSGGETGLYYREVVRLTQESLKTAKDRFPQYKQHELELAGFGWHQGWNDRINQELNDAYEENMANFIRDIRRDLGAEDLPFVIAETGMSGRTEAHPRALSLMKAQAAVANKPEFHGNVAFVGTRDFFRPREESPSGQAYHWNSNAETYYLIGEAMGKAMLELIGSHQPSSHQPGNVQVGSGD